LFYFYVVVVLHLVTK